MTNAQKLAVLNTFREVAGLPALTVWRVARNQTELNAYQAEEALQIAREERMAELTEAPVMAALGRRKGGGPKTRFSSIAKPCAVVWAFYGEHRDMPRKEAIAKLVEMGVDKGTANIQYGKAARAQW